MKATLVFCISAALCLSATKVARAQDCPEEVPTSSRQRRALAKEWFSRAEAAESDNQPIVAVKAYQCSLKMVPHAFTAFNLGRLAEQTGDLELAVESFNTYVKLAPTAPDRADIETKVANLSARIQALRREQAETALAPAPPEPEPAPEPETVEPQPPPPMPDLTPPETRAPPVSEAPPGLIESGSAPGVGTAAYIVGGVAVASLASAVFLNLSARSKMDECNKLAAQATTQPAINKANAQCDAARPRAYASYALFGLAGAAAVADAVLILWGLTPKEQPVDVAVYPGGATVGTTFRF